MFIDTRLAELLNVNFIIYFKATTKEPMQQNYQMLLKQDNI